MMAAHSARSGFGILILALALWGCGQSPGASSATADSHLVAIKSAPPATPAETADQAVLQVTEGLANHQAQVIWDALPASYQNDVTDLVHEFAQKMDPEIWNQSFATLGKITDVLKTKKDVILGMNQFQANPNIKLDEVAQNWDHVVDPLVAITHSEVSNLETLKRLDVRKTLGTTGVQLLKDIEVLSDVAPGNASAKLSKLAQTKATLIREDGDSSLVLIEVPGEQPTQDRFVRVEGKWIPQDMADQWSKKIAEAHSELANWSNQELAEKKPQVMRVLDALDGIVDTLAQANTPEQFEQSLQGGMFHVMGLIMTFSQPQESDDAPSSADAAQR